MQYANEPTSEYYEIAQKLARDWTQHFCSSEIASRISLVQRPSGDFGGRSCLLEDGRGRIEINDGTFLMAADTFSRLLAMSQVWDSVGEPQLEDDQPKLTRLSRNAEDLIYQGQPDALMRDEFYTPTPKCPIRLVYSTALAAMSIEYLVLHELGHILLGHNGFLDSKANESVDDLLRSSLELDADAFAVGHLLKRWTVDDPLRRAAVPQSNDVLNTQYAVDVFRATYTVFMLRDGGDRWVHPPLDKHPPDRLRQSSIMTCLIEALPESDRPLIRQLFAIEANGMNQHHDWITGKTGGTTGISTLQTDAATMLPLLGKLPELRGVLKPFSWAYSQSNNE